MADIIKALDVSYLATPRAITEAEWRRASARGWGLAVVGSHHGLTPNVCAEASLRNARAAGLETATYIALTPRHRGADDVDTGYRECGAEWSHLAFVAVDVELVGLTETHVREAVARVEALGGRPCIYTAQWYWQYEFGNPATFAHLPLWSADYDGDGRLDYPRPYGGWVEEEGDIVAKQYAGWTSPAGKAEGDALGFAVDLNVFDARWVAAGRRQAVALTDKQRELLEYLDGPQGAAVAQPLRGNLLEQVGLPRDARLADYADGSGSAPSPEEAKPEPKPPAATPAAREARRKELLEHAAADIAAAMEV